MTGKGVLDISNYQLGDKYCAKVQFKDYYLHPNLPNHVFVTPDLTNVTGLNPLHSVAMFTTEHWYGGFTACAVITGRQQSPVTSNISFVWTVAQDGIAEADKGAMEIGVVHMPTWTTGSRCLPIPFKHVSY